MEGHADPHLRYTLSPEHPIGGGGGGGGGGRGGSSIGGVIVGGAISTGGGCRTGDEKGMHTISNCTTRPTYHLQIYIHVHMYIVYTTCMCTMRSVCVHLKCM